MSEEQLKAADADAAKEEEEAIEEISEEGLDGVVGGAVLLPAGQEDMYPYAAG